MPAGASKSGTWYLGTQGYRAESWEVGNAGEIAICILDAEGHELAQSRIAIPVGDVFATYFCSVDDVTDAGVFALGKAGEAGAFYPRRAWRYDPESRTLQVLDATRVRCAYSD